MLNLLNVVPDEKFIDNVIEYHDYTSETAHHVYVNVSLRRKQTFQYISKKHRIIQIHPRKFFKYVANNPFDGIIIHNLAAFLPNLIIKIPKEIPVMWSSWGMDIYSYPKGAPVVSIKNMHHNMTAAALKLQHPEPLISKIKSLLKTLISGESIHPDKRIQAYMNAIRRFNLFSCVVPLEYELIKRNEFFHAKYVEYHYYNTSLFGTITQIKPKSDIILIGNSAAPTNNHLEIFHHLSKLDTSKFKILAPLNYGSDNEWKDQLVKAGRTTFGNRFEPITGFLPFKEYAELLSKCSHAIFYHERQQAMGNIYSLLENGCKLFLSENSVTYQYLKSLGVQVFSIQTELTQHNLDNPLSYNLAKTNNEIVSRLIHSKSKAITELHNLYNEFNNFKQAHGN